MRKLKEKGKGNGEKETGNGKGNHKVKWREKKGMEKGGKFIGKGQGEMGKTNTREKIKGKKENGEW